MNLTNRERTILQLSRQGLSDYKIARKMSIDPPSVTRSRKNAHKKLEIALTDLQWATQIGLNTLEFNSNTQQYAASFNFFL